MVDTGGFNNKNIQQNLRNLTWAEEVDNGTIGVGATIDWSLGNLQKATFFADSDINFEFSDPKYDQPGFYTLRLIQPAGGSFKVTDWGAGIQFPFTGFGDPPLSTIITTPTILQFFYDGTNFWLINVSPNYYISSVAAFAEGHT